MAREYWPTRLLIIYLAAGALGADQANARWQPGGVPVCALPGYQQYPIAIADGVGGAYVSWIDERPGGAGVYVEKIDGEGTIPAGWPANGLRVGELSFNRALAADGSGGVVVAWLVGTTVYAQRITSAGTIHPNWPVAGARVSLPNPSVLRVQYLAAASDGTGGLYVSWETNSCVFIPEIGCVQYDWAARIQRVDG